MVLINGIEILISFIRIGNKSMSKQFVLSRLSSFTKDTSSVGFTHYFQIKETITLTNKVNVD